MISYVLMSFVYDIIDPRAILGIPAKYGLICNSNVKMYPPPTLSYICIVKSPTPPTCVLF